MDCTSISVAESSTAAVEKEVTKPARMPPAISGTTAAIKDKSEELKAVLEAETRLLRTRTAMLVDELGLAPRASARLTNELVIAYLGTMAMMLREPYLHAIDDGEATARSLLQAALTRADGPARDLVDELVTAGHASR